MRAQEYQCRKNKDNGTTEPIAINEQPNLEDIFDYTSKDSCSSGIEMPETAQTRVV